MPAATRGQQFREEAALSLRTYGLFPRFRMKTTLKTAASCALPPGVCAAHDLIVVLLVVALCAIRGAKRLIFFRSDGGKKCATGANAAIASFPGCVRKISHRKFGLKSCESEKSEALSCSVVQCRLPV